MTLKCETCCHWMAISRSSSFAAVCALDSFPGRVQFDQSCAQHSSAPKPPAAQDQSNARPAIVQMFVPGAKP